MQSNSSAQAASDVFLTARDMRRRNGNVSDMWLYRREHDGSLNFPKPIRISGRRFLAIERCAEMGKQPQAGGGLSCRGFVTQKYERRLDGDRKAAPQGTSEKRLGST